MAGEPTGQIVGSHEREALDIAVYELEWALHGRPENFRVEDRYVTAEALRMMRAEFEELTGDLSWDSETGGARRFLESVVSYGRSIDKFGTDENITGGYFAHLRKTLKTMRDAPEVLRTNLVKTYASLAAHLGRRAEHTEKDEERSLRDLGHRAHRLSGALVKYKLLFKPVRLQALLFMAQLFRADETIEYGERMLRSIGWEGLDKPRFPANFDNLTAAIVGYNWDVQRIVVMDEVPGSIRRGGRGGAPQTPPAGEPPAVPPAAAPAGSASPAAGANSSASSATSGITGAGVFMEEAVNPISVPPQFQSAGMQVAWGGMMVGGMPRMAFPPPVQPIPMQAGLAAGFERLAQ